MELPVDPKHTNLKKGVDFKWKLKKRGYLPKVQNGNFLHLVKLKIKNLQKINRLNDFIPLWLCNACNHNEEGHFPLIRSVVFLGTPLDILGDSLFVGSLEINFHSERKKKVYICINNIMHFKQRNALTVQYKVHCPKNLSFFIPLVL